MNKNRLLTPLAAAIAMSLMSGCVNTVRMAGGDWSPDPAAEWPGVPDRDADRSDDAEASVAESAPVAAALRRLLADLHTELPPPAELEELARLVQAQIDHFQTRWHDGFEQALDRGAKYRPLMRTELRRRELPEELAYLPLIESAYRLNAHSHAKARGMWQFIPATGRAYGLTGKGWGDLRLDPLASSKAAARLLRDLHDYYEGDVMLALAAYNAGQTRIDRAIRANGGVDRFVPIRAHLHRETRAYVPRFLAAVLMARDPGRYGIAPPREQGYAYFQLYRRVALGELTARGRVSVDELRALNDDLGTHDSTPPIGNYVLRVPDAAAAPLMARLDAIRWNPDGATQLARAPASPPAATPTPTTTVARSEPVEPSPRIAAIELASSEADQDMPRVTDRLRYTVRAGDTLSEIAEWFGAASVEDIRAANPGVGNGRNLQVGESLWLVNPTPWGWVDREHVVRRGESLGRIARRFGVSVQSLRALNDVGDTLRVGQSLRVIHTIRDAGPYQVEYRVRSGNTLSGIAEAFNVRVADLRRWNGLGKGGLMSGRDLLIYPEEALVERQYRVRRGDVLSTIAARLGVDVVHLVTVNGLANANDIRVGRQLSYFQSPSRTTQTAGLAGGNRSLS